MATSQDSVVRTFDVPTGQLVDAFRTKTVATSLSFSPTGDFLATTHVGSVGVYLWYVVDTSRLSQRSDSLPLSASHRANRAQFSEVGLKTFVEENDLETVALPTVQGLLDDECTSCLPSSHRLPSL